MSKSRDFKEFPQLVLDRNIKGSHPFRQKDIGIETIKFVAKNSVPLLNTA